MKKLISKLAVILVLLIGQTATAQWMRSRSLEWWTNMSDTVAVADVSSVKKLDPLQGNAQSQEFLCTPVETLKGERIESFTFRESFHGNDANKEVFDAALQPGNRVLLFYAGADNRKAKVIFWVNLTNPDGKWAHHAAYNNDCKLLDKADSILTLVKARIAKENPKAPEKKRGVIVNFTAYEPQDMRWEFVRTADPEYKAVLIKDLAEDDKESAIYNLISYPGKETCDLIRPFLTDRKTTEVRNVPVNEASGIKHDSITIYPLRQAAYSALTLLGETPQKPEGYYAGQDGWFYSVGFENRVYFPQGDWKRIERTK